MRYEEFRAAGEVLGPVYYIAFKASAEDAR